MSSAGTYSIAVQIQGAAQAGQQITQLGNSMKQVDSSIQGLTSVMNQLGSSFQSIASRISSVNAPMAEIKSNSQALAQGNNALANSFTQLTSSTQRTGAIFTQIGTSMNQAGTAASQFSAKITGVTAPLNNVGTAMQRLTEQEGLLATGQDALSTTFTATGANLQRTGAIFTQTGNQAGQMASKMESSAAGVRTMDTATKTTTTSSLNLGRQFGFLVPRVAGMAISFQGLTNAMQESAGMHQMLLDAQKRVADAQQKLTEDTAKYGAGSKHATRDTQELEKAQRALAVTARNAGLSQGDIATFVTLLAVELTHTGVNAVRTFQQALTQLQSEGKTLGDVFALIPTKIKGVGTAFASAVTSIGGFVTGSKTATTQSGLLTGALNSAGLAATTGGTRFGGLGTAIAALVGAGGLTSLASLLPSVSRGVTAFNTVSAASPGILGKVTGAFSGFAAGLGPVGLALTALGIAVVAYQTNFLGFRDAVNTAASAVASAFQGFVGALSQAGSAVGTFLGQAADFLALGWEGVANRLSPVSKALTDLGAAFVSAAEAAGKFIASGAAQLVGSAGTLTANKATQGFQTNIGNQPAPGQPSFIEQQTAADQAKSKAPNIVGENIQSITGQTPLDKFRQAALATKGLSKTGVANSGLNAQQFAADSAALRSNTQATTENAAASERARKAAQTLAAQKVLAAQLTETYSKKIAAESDFLKISSQFHDAYDKAIKKTDNDLVTNGATIAANNDLLNTQGNVEKLVTLGKQDQILALQNLQKANIQNTGSLQVYEAQLKSGAQQTAQYNSGVLETHKNLLDQESALAKTRGSLDEMNTAITNGTATSIAFTQGQQEQEKALQDTQLSISKTAGSLGVYSQQVQSGQLTSLAFTQGQQAQEKALLDSQVALAKSAGSLQTYDQQISSGLPQQVAFAQAIIDYGKAQDDAQVKTAGTIGTITAMNTALRDGSAQAVAFGTGFAKGALDIATFATNIEQAKGNIAGSLAEFDQLSNIMGVKVPDAISGSIEATKQFFALMAHAPDALAEVDKAADKTFSGMVDKIEQALSGGTGAVDKAFGEIENTLSGHLSNMDKDTITGVAVVVDDIDRGLKTMQADLKTAQLVAPPLQPPDMTQFKADVNDTLNDVQNDLNVIGQTAPGLKAKFQPFVDLIAKMPINNLQDAQTAMGLLQQIEDAMKNPTSTLASSFGDMADNLVLLSKNAGTAQQQLDALSKSFEKVTGQQLNQSAALQTGIGLGPEIGLGTATQDEITAAQQQRAPQQQAAGTAGQIGQAAQQALGPLSQLAQVVVQLSRDFDLASTSILNFGSGLAALVTTGVATSAAQFGVLQNVLGIVAADFDLSTIAAFSFGSTLAALVTTGVSTSAAQFGVLQSVLGVVAADFDLTTVSAFNFGSALAALVTAGVTTSAAQFGVLQNVLGVVVQDFNLATQATFNFGSTLAVLVTTGIVTSATQFGILQNVLGVVAADFDLATLSTFNFGSTLAVLVTTGITTAATQFGILQNVLVVVAQDFGLAQVATDLFSTSLANLTVAIGTAVGALDILARAIATLTDDINVLARAVVTVTGDLNNMGAAAQTATSRFSALTSALSNTTNALNTAARAVVTMTGDINNMGAAASSASGKMNSLRSSISGVGSQASSAASEVRSLASAINSLQNRTITITTVFRTVGSPAFAAGGAMLASSPTRVLVGESGPEAVGRMRAAAGIQGMIVNHATSLTVGESGPEFLFVKPINNNNNTKSGKSDTRLPRFLASGTGTFTTTDPEQVDMLIKSISDLTKSMNKAIQQQNKIATSNMFGAGSMKGVLGDPSIFDLMRIVGIDYSKFPFTIFGNPPLTGGHNHGTGGGNNGGTTTGGGNDHFINGISVGVNTNPPPFQGVQEFSAIDMFNTVTPTPPPNTGGNGSGNHHHTHNPNPNTWHVIHRRGTNAYSVVDSDGNVVAATFSSSNSAQAYINHNKAISISGNGSAMATAGFATASSPGASTSVFDIPGGQVSLSTEGNGIASASVNGHHFHHGGDGGSTGGTGNNNTGRETVPPLIESGVILHGGWGGDEDNPDGWKVVHMKDDPNLFKVVDAHGVNISTNFTTQAAAQRYIDHFKAIKHGGTTGGGNDTGGGTATMPPTGTRPQDTGLASFPLPTRSGTDNIIPIFDNSGEVIAASTADITGGGEFTSLKDIVPGLHTSTDTGSGGGGNGGSGGLHHNRRDWRWRHGRIVFDDDRHHEYGDIDIGGNNNSQGILSAQDIQALTQAFIDAITKAAKNDNNSSINANIYMDSQLISKAITKAKVSKIGVWQPV